jgi:hypothetical protein
MVDDERKRNGDVFGVTVTEMATRDNRGHRHVLAMTAAG